MKNKFNYFLAVFMITSLFSQPEFPIVTPYFYPIEETNGYPHLEWTRDNPDNRVIGYYIYKTITHANGERETFRIFSEFTYYNDTTFIVGGIKPFDLAKYYIIALGTTGGEADMSFPSSSRTVYGHCFYQKEIVAQIGRVDSFSLSSIYPNPFNTSTYIKYHLPKDSFVTISIYDLKGRRINTLMNQFKTAGLNEIKWDAKDSAGNSVPSGVYFYRLDAISLEGDKEFHQTRKLILIR